MNMDSEARSTSFHDVHHFSFHDPGFIVMMHDVHHMMTKLCTDVQSSIRKFGRLFCFSTKCPRRFSSSSRSGKWEKKLDVNDNRRLMESNVPNPNLPTLAKSMSRRQDDLTRKMEANTELAGKIEELVESEKARQLSPESQRLEDSEGVELYERMLDKFKVDHAETINSLIQRKTEVREVIDLLLANKPKGLRKE
jgi:hypothetical protein